METQGTEESPGHGHADHSPFLAHHFDTPHQQFATGKLGMWIFLVTEILLFGGLFVAYSVFRANHPEIFQYAAEEFLDKTLGAVNTAVLIFSSFTMAWAVRCAQRSRRQGLMVLLSITIACGFVFMGVKYVEYKHKWEEGLLWASQFDPVPHGEGGGHGDDHGDSADHGAEPGHEAPATAAETPVAAISNTPTENSEAAPQPEGEDPAAKTEIEAAETNSDASGPEGDLPAAGDDQTAPLHEADNQIVSPADRGVQESSHGFRTSPKNVGVFFSIYFVMTGLHGLHVLAGMAAIGWVLTRAWKGHFDANYFGPVDYVGLYWHLVDLVWIYLFPLLYLIH
jgi:cytochrome c oxidase subunit 3